MKHITRIVATVAALLLSLTLTGCGALDELRASQGFWNEDNFITFGGTSYYPLPECELLTPVSAYEYPDTVYITKSDVPVLLSGIIGDRFSVIADGVFLCPEWTGLGKAFFYCRADRYESVLKQIQDGPALTGFCYEYLRYEEETGYVSKRYVLTPEQVDTVNLILDTVVPHTAYALDWTYMVTLEACSEDLYFRGGEYDLLFLGNRYYLVTNSANSNQEPLVCDVPTEYNSLFATIMKDAVEAQQQEGEPLYDDYIGF